ncbi:hypothetical protein FP731_15470 [Vibrio parahaemolyticus]|nr:hypothetical protein [Vibrio parahaemolyticus]EGQ9147488.1 hypothetical protein [Vibrio parahaemolyticus]EGQ9587676.1 hypothetical protein [Vibrio parahaemolyticus]EGR1607730.1 hypothetical protein [Vibrio parahaemolyticus]EGR2049785.1 hypothetical protein [Vibrio parahaemolyticus]
MEEVAAHLNLLANSLGMYSMLFLLWSHNAQLRGEQRLHPNLKHCAINTKFEVEAKMPSVVNPS